jgi:hypothetical protein
LNNILVSAVGILEVVGEPRTLRRALMLLLKGRIIGLTLAWYAWQLLLALGHPNAPLQPSILVLASGGVAGSSESNLLILILIVLDVQLGLASLYLVALLAYALIRNIIALFLVFLLLVPDLEMPIDEGGGKFILGDGGRQKL